VVVDDEPDNLGLLVRTFCDQYDVRDFTDPQQALAVSVKLKPVALIVDFRMGGMNGVELVQALRKAGVECAVLMTTAYAGLPEVTEAEQGKVLFQVIPKPWHPDDLRAQLNLAISSFRLGKTRQRLAKTGIGHRSERFPVQHLIERPFLGVVVSPEPRATGTRATRTSRSGIWSSSLIGPL